MKKFILTLALIAFALIATGHVQADSVAGKSATMTAGQDEDMPITLVTGTERVKQKIAMKRVLERYGSPLASTVDGFIDTPLLLRTGGMTQRGHIYNIGIDWMNNDTTDAHCTFQAHLFPGAPCIR